MRVCAIFFVAILNCSCNTADSKLSKEADIEIEKDSMSQSPEVTTVDSILNNFPLSDSVSSIKISPQSQTTDECKSFKGLVKKHWVQGGGERQNVWTSNFANFELMVKGSSCMIGKQMDLIEDVLGTSYTTLPSRGEHLRYYSLIFTDSTALQSEPLNKVEAINLLVTCVEKSDVIKKISYPMLSKPVMEDPD